MATVKPITPQLLARILPWWEERDCGAMPADVLPPLGICAVDADGPIAAAWLYEPYGCKVAMLDWLVTRPGERPRYVRAACRAVFEELTRLADTRGFTRIFASAERWGMVREAEACGFTVAAANCTHLVKHL